MNLGEADAILFDYGNTLIEFGPRQMTFLSNALERYLAEFAPVDSERLRRIRARQVSAPFENGYRENDLAALCAELYRELVGVEPTEEQTNTLVRLRCTSFEACVEASVGVAALLGRLRDRHRLALVSNYPCSRCVRESLEKVGYADLFEVVVVSADIGWCKPHPQLFQAALDGLGVPAERCVFVGDHWLADVQGAKSIGMRAVHTTEYTPYERIIAKPGDHQPDARIAQLSELEALLNLRSS